MALNSSITGTIYETTNAPLAGVSVNAFDKDLRSEQKVGEALTNQKGFYKIDYDSESFSHSENKSTDIFLRVFNPAGTVIGTSPVNFNVPTNFVLDFKIDGTPFKGNSEFDGLVNTINQLLQNQRVKMADLKENEQLKDISFLAGETGTEFRKISFLPPAFSFSEKTSIAPDIFYGLFRMSFPVELNALLSVKTESILKAIKQAIEENIISSKWTNELESIAKNFNSAAVKQLHEGSDNQATDFKKVIGAALNSDQQKIFLDTYFTNEGNPEKFWEQLKLQPAFTDGQSIEKIQQVLRLNVVTGSQPELTNQLFKAQDRDIELKDSRGFAKYNRADWKGQIETAGVTKFPDWVPGSTPEEKTKNYAASLEQLHKQLYPTTFFAQRIKQDTQSSFALKPELDIFFNRNPDFDLQTNSIHNQFEQSNFESIQDKEGLKKELKTLNRLYKLTDDYKKVDALYGKQLFSSADIVTKYGREEFVKQFAATTEESAEASKLYNKAVSVNNKATALITAYKTRHDIIMYAIHGINEAPEGYHEMFGDGELCECEHCQSVYSPGAYFVDILAFIKSNNTGAFDELLRRRPDLDDILLTCKNTNTPLPYIDLANELLGKKVLNLERTDLTTPNPEDHSFQTEGTAAELSSMPEHINDPAYIPLKNIKGDAVFSPLLPLDHSLEEIRVYVEKSGWNRLELMESFYGKKEPGILNDPTLAAELFGFSEYELKIINGTVPLNITLPQYNTIRAFLEKTKLSYIELLQLLEAYFLNPKQGSGRTLFIDQEPEAGVEVQVLTCNLDKLFISGASDAWLNKLTRFVRLWKKLEWNIFDLDRVLMALGLTDFPATESEFNERLLLPLSHIQKIKRQLNLPLPEVLMLISNIDTSIYRDHSEDSQPLITSLYQQMFLNKAVTNPYNNAFENWEALTGTLVPLHQETLIAAFGVSLSDLMLLVREGDQLSLSTLSRLYRFVLLSKALRSTVRELLNIISIAGNTLADGNWTAKTILLFLEDWNLFKSSGIESDNYQLLLNTKVGTEYKLPVDTILIAAFEGHINALNVIKNITDTEQQKTELDSRIELIIQSLTGIKTVLEDSTLKLVHPDDLVLRTNIESYFGEKNKEILLSATPDEIITRTTNLNSSFKEYLFWKSTPNIFKTMGFDIIKIHWLEANKVPTGTSLLWNEPIDFSNTAVYTAFQKLFYLSNLNKIKTSDDLNWTNLLDKAIKNQSNAKTEFFDLFIKLYHVPENNLITLAGLKDEINDKGELNFIFPNDFKEAKVLSNLLSCSKLMDKLSATGQQLQALIASNAFPENAKAVKALLKSKYNNTDWLIFIKPINDRLRTRRRDALLAWLLANAGENKWNKFTDIYETLLIDVEMEACMMTSRIKQAINSVQLYVDRCLLNLETGIQLDGRFADQWHKWRKLYRVWEANRKVFLYPENWIEPELRDGKSSFFKELESQLKQNEITEETAKDALLAYLDKLDTVANLEMIGLFNDQEKKIVHVFGRTHNVPHQYYYRRLEKSVWSAWEKVEIDIEGDHILPVVWNGRLMLFWLQFKEQQQKETGGTSIKKANAEGTMEMESIPPSTCFEMKLVWSELKKGKWSSKKISKVTATTSAGLPKNQIQLSSDINNGKLFVKILFWKNTGFAKYLTNLPSGTFIFDSCNNSPSVGNSPEQQLIVPSEMDGDAMVLLEKNPDDNSLGLGLFKNGLFQDFSGTYNSVEPKQFRNTPGKFQILPDHHEIEKSKPVTFFYNNEIHNFYVYSIEMFRPALGDFSVDNAGILMSRRTVLPVNTDATLTGNPNTAVHLFITDASNDSFNPDLFDAVNEREPVIALSGKKYVFQTFFHPFVCEYIKKLNTEGFEALYSSDTQNKDPKPIFTTIAYNPPTGIVSSPFPVEEVDFSYFGSYALYNWELFFHIPLLVATRLSQNQKFEEARKWFHFIYDPTKSSSPGGSERFWTTNPFKNEIIDGIVSLEQLLLRNEYAEELDVQLENWANNPFNPHAVARLRISAYMRHTVLRYIDNLIAWGDQLFKRDTIESINEATLLYVLASKILGKKPEKVPALGNPAEMSFSLMKDHLDSFSNVMTELEAFISSSSHNDGDEKILMPYFCIPKNDFLLKYWDTISDRLFKIRNCQNIEGVFRQPPLSDPPIDPALLVRATAAGLDLNTILNDLNASLPYYRFQVMLQQSNEICNDVRMLGGALLSALEKKDAEELSLLRSRQELKMLEMIRDIKGKQRDEAKENLDSITSNRTVVEKRYEFYTANASSYVNQSEKLYFDASQNAIDIQRILELRNYLASVLHIIPDAKIGSGFTIGATYGGGNLGRGESAAINALQSISSLHRIEAEISNIKGSYDRRMEEWKFQAKTAELELQQIDKQIVAAEIRLAIAEKDLENHDLQMEHSQEVNDFMHDKFTNAELYDWMTAQLSTVYFQTYQLAYTIAKKAEKCLQYELGLEGTSYIQFGYWDNLKQGLVSGEKLQYDIRRLENTYMEKNKRSFEITKHISMAMLNPMALMVLRDTGSCEITLPEELFDLDFPGHYLRRIKSMSVSIPCIAGPYTSINASLRLTKNEYRLDKTTTGGYKKSGDDDSRFRTVIHPISAIATSNSQNDSGVFELNFRDERYLPFEGAGAISSWKLELIEDKALRQFDYNSISDIILHLKYTSSEDSALKANAITNLKNVLTDAVNGKIFGRLLSLKNDFPDEFHRMKSENSAVTITKELKVGKMFFPYFVHHYTITYKSCIIYNKDGSALTFPMTVTNNALEIINDDWKLSINYNPSDLGNLEDVYLLLNYTLMSP